MRRERLRSESVCPTCTVFDALLSTIARLADIHVKPEPGTDGTLAFHTISLLIIDAPA